MRKAKEAKEIPRETDDIGHVMRNYPDEPSDFVSVVDFSARGPTGGLLDTSDEWMAMMDAAVRRPVVRTDVDRRPGGAEGPGRPSETVRDETS